MLFFTGVWLPLLLVCWLCGAAVLERATGAGAFRRAGDRLIFSIWLGLVILAQTLLAASLFVPLTPLCGAAVAVVLSGVALLSRGVRAEAIRLKRLLRPRLLLGLLALSTGVAACASQPVKLYDTGLYHFQNVKWLAEHGAVRGLALVQLRFAFASAWFALAAPFDAGPFESRAAAVACGFALLVAVMHALLCARRCAAGAGRGADWLVLLSFALVLPPIFVWRMPASASPDLPLFFLALIVVWAISLLEEEKGGASARLLPVLLAAGAVGLKLNGLPLLVVASVYYARGGGFSTRRLLTAGALVALMLLPTIAHGLVTSGCPVFPSKLLCVEAPWSVGEGEAERLTRVIRDWSRWNGTGLHWKNDWSWLGPWATKGFTSRNLFVTPLCLLTAC
ncbi:MAG: LIC_10190 family membrane protein, partial [Pyrinomonadaceae bacterium]